VRRVWILGVVVAVMLVASGASASPGVSDIAATRTFIADATAFLTDAVSSSSRSKALVNAVIGHLASTCPGSLATGQAKESSAQRRTRVALLREAYFEAVLAQISPLKRSAKHLINRVEHLRWGIPKLDDAVRTFLRADRAALAIKAPDSCNDIKVAASAGFTTIPGATSRLIKAEARAETSNSVADIANLMVRLTGHDERRALDHLRHLQNQINRLEGKLAFNTIERIRSTLGSG
jgi:hypothetical protein